MDKPKIYVYKVIGEVGWVEEISHLEQAMHYSKKKKKKVQDFFG